MCVWAAVARIQDGCSEQRHATEDKTEEETHSTVKEPLERQGTSTCS